MVALANITFAILLTLSFINIILRDALGFFLVLLTYCYCIIAVLYFNIIFSNTIPAVLIPVFAFVGYLAWTLERRRGNE